MKPNSKSMVSITLIVLLLLVLFGSGCSLGEQVSVTPEPIVTPEASIQIISLDMAKETPSATIALTPQPVETQNASLLAAESFANTSDTPAYSDVRGQCIFAVSSHRSTFFYARDASSESVWKSSKGEQSIAIEVQSDISNIKGFYFKWDEIPPTWDLYAYDSDGKEILIDNGGKNEGLTEFAEVPASMSEYKKFKFVSTNPETAFAIANLSVFAGGIPEYVPRWESIQNNQVDLLVIAAHPDDESVFLAAPVVTYINEGKTVATGYMTWGAAYRRFEAEEACWMLGEKYAPTLRSAHDMMTNSLESMEKYWPLDDAVGYIVELIRKYKPSVIITHDIGGEYGHGAHIETSYATQLAFDQASDATKFPESAEKYGVWKPGKLYLHMYDEGKMTFDINTPLRNYNGETVFQVATAAFERHRSQAAKGWTIESTGECSMEYFGLFASNVGSDKNHDSMFENITPSIMDEINGIGPDAHSNH